MSSKYKIKVKQTAYYDVIVKLDDNKHPMNCEVLEYIKPLQDSKLVDIHIEAFDLDKAKLIESNK